MSRLPKSAITPLAPPMLLYIAVSVVGVTWGLPTRDSDQYLFPDGGVWSGEKIRALVQADRKFADVLGADVDPDALARDAKEPIHIAASDADAAKIYLRYRLYTYQPDEMITMMALAGMRPGELKFDPRLYQYGGLFIYPVGALLKLCDVLGIIDVRSDVTYYLDHPDEFGKFYVVARLYSAAWGLSGLLLVFGIARRVASFDKEKGKRKKEKSSFDRLPLDAGPFPLEVDAHANLAGLIAAAFFALMPVVVCMSHEAKPHLPGAVLMLAAVYFGIRYLQEIESGARAGSASHSTIDNRPSTIAPISGWMARRVTRFFWLMCASCGAALGMVLSSAPIFVLIPLVAWLGRSRTPDSFAVVLKRVVGGTLVGVFLYLLTNPYIVINLFVNREVLRSNFGNSLAMYQVSRVAEGFVRVLELTREGATLPVLVFGAAAGVVALLQRRKAAAVLAVPAFIFLVQFVLIGAGKPAEYGRFGIFPNTALAIGTACAIAGAWNRRSLLARTAGVLVVLWVAIGGSAYLRGFWLDTTRSGSRAALARTLAEGPLSESRPIVALLAEPAPYSCPPLDFAKADVILLREESQFASLESGQPKILLYAVDVPPEDSSRALSDRPFPWLSWLAPVTPISWADKPFVVKIDTENLRPQ